MRIPPRQFLDKTMKEDNSEAVVAPTVLEFVKAVQFGEFAVIRDAIDSKKIAATDCDQDGCSLLHWSAINNRLEIASYLLEYGADVNLAAGILQESPLMWAIRSGNNPKIIKLFIEKGASLTHTSVESIDPLQLACRLGHINCCFLLLHSGANPNAFDKQRNNCLLWLLKNRPTDKHLITLLLKFGINIDHRDENNDTALHIASKTVRRNSKEVDLFLIFRFVEGVGGDIAIRTKNNAGHTPYTYAEMVSRNPTAMRFFWDYWMYQKFPYLFPTLFSFVSMYGFFFLLSTCGWYGVLYWLIFLFLPNNQFCQPTIEIGDSRAIVGSTLGAYTSVFLAYHQYIAHHVSQYVNVIMSILILSTSILYALLIRSKPKYIQTSTQADRSMVLDKLILDGATGDESEDKNSLCPTCLVDHRKHSYHCPRCDRCVLDIDHHNATVMNCIGRGNRRLFVSFVCFSSLTFAWFVIMALYTQGNEYCKDSNGVLFGFFSIQYCMIFENLAFFAISVMAFIMMGVNLNNMLMQCYSVAIETTTFELLNGQHDGRCRHSMKSGLNTVMQHLKTGEYHVVSYPVPMRTPHDHDHKHGHGKVCCGPSEQEVLAPLGHSMSIDALERA